MTVVALEDFRQGGLFDHGTRTCELHHREERSLFFVTTLSSAENF